jgi:hypothetical protein
MWTVLGDKISSLIFFPKTAPHKAFEAILLSALCASSERRERARDILEIP